MKLLALLIALAVPGSAMRAALSPVTRVVQLLQGMSERIEKDGKKEEDLYETYVCWAKSVISQKTASNEKATSRIDSLEAYIADLDAGRVELTSERQDLEKELAALNSDMETATALRDKEKEDFEAAKGEMDAAIAALKDAIAVLKEGMGDGATLLSLSSKLNGGYRARAMESQNLERAVELGGQFLSKGDALFLQRVLTAEVPQKDWKKLNRKATFKMSYKARSGKILETLEKMLVTFEDNLSDAQDREDKAQDTFDTLMESKGTQKEEAEEALSTMGVEGAARGLTKTEAQSEIEALREQVKDDKKFIGQTEEDLKKKKEEWTDRKGIRIGELEAISKAISILHSDDARDLFKKSFSSQGYFFLQEGSTSLLSRRKLSMREAAVALQKAARASKDTRLAVLASTLSRVPSHFEKVVAAIDEMIGILKDEEETDLKNKENCEKERAADLRESIKLSREMDDLTDTIDRLNEEIKELDDEIKEKEKEIADISKALKEATVNREEENAEWKVANQEDIDAMEIVGQAIKVLKDFYASVALVQKGSKQPFQTTAGEAPPPPPPTWEAPYTGKQEENTGVVAILTMIKQDMNKDRKKAKAMEDEAQSAFDTFKKDSEDEIATLEGDISTLEGDISKKDEAIVSAEGDRNDKKGLLEGTMKKIKEEAPGCDFVTVNYEIRVKNRQIEIDGLNKAKAILSGASFSD